MLAFETGVDPRSLAVGIHPDDLLEAILDYATRRAERAE